MGHNVLVMSFGSDAGGVERSLIEFLHFLVNQGENVDLYLWRKPGILFSQIPEKVHILDNKLYPGSLRAFDKKYNLKHYIWYGKFRMAQAAGNPVKVFKPLEKQYDLAISFCQNGYSPYYVIDKVDAKKKYLFYHHGSYEKSPEETEKDRKYYGKYDKVITVSQANRDMLLRVFPELDSKLLVIHNLVDEKAILEKATQEVEHQPDSGCTITTVGRIAPEKGQKLALKAAKILKEQAFPFKWYFIGDGPEFDECLNLIEKYDLSDCCFLLGAKENPYPYIRLADLYVQTSSVEADPITIREALILKKMILASDIPAIQEALQDGFLGILMPQNAQRIAQTIVKTYADEKMKLMYRSRLEQMSSVNGESVEKFRKILAITC